jgi:hypothetical protein
VRRFEAALQRGCTVQDEALIGTGLSVDETLFHLLT